MDENKNNDKQIFRKKTLERISTPEQLTDYLKVTNPGVWVILIAVIILLSGLLLVASVGTLTTEVDAKVTVKDGGARVIEEGNQELDAGMKLIIKDEEYELNSVDEDRYGRYIAYANVPVEDGVYDGRIILEEIKLINFLLKSS